MKFKTQDKQNQPIENITAHHLVVGVDIAQEVHVARALFSYNTQGSFLPQSG
ncbi:hypothetical protein [Paenibacillus sp. UNC451MF]|uniref:hypothetical protein n=1 Tax=Paenibacillus sp. UNC451MF TaxID=1449063 RepID=UPI0012DE0E64|nr:hypothetical protein [Paenibacillus sp. UNC451MF]